VIKGSEPEVDKGDEGEKMNGENTKRKMRLF
jgi:hypothetical protein